MCIKSNIHGGMNKKQTSTTIYAKYIKGSQNVVGTPWMPCGATDGSDPLLISRSVPVPVAPGADPNSRLEIKIYKYLQWML